MTIHRDWCPLLSYTGNLGRMREALLDAETARNKFEGLLQSGRSQFVQNARPGPFGRGRGGFNVTVKQPPPAPSRGDDAGRAEA